ncbi:MAG: hypothetical protein MIO92_13600, partial [Methanosarcinaceae archaeon]|nr:hypothetical protein [Methanosarcinaceae archaeon]
MKRELFSIITAISLIINTQHSMISGGFLAPPGTAVETELLPRFHGDSWKIPKSIFMQNALLRSDYGDEWERICEDYTEYVRLFLISSHPLKVELFGSISALSSEQIIENAN